MKRNFKKMNSSISRYTFFFLMISIKVSYGQSPDLKRRADSLYQQQEWTAAKNTYLKIVGDDSTNSLAWNRIGYCNQNLGFYWEAIENYKKAIRHNPSVGIKSSALLRMSMSYSLLNQLKESEDNLVKATNLGYNSLKDLDSLPAFKNLRAAENFSSLRKKINTIVFPCSGEIHNRDFDFWLGDWNCYQIGTEILSGVSHVEMMAGGCAILENYTSVQAYTGKSFNYYDTVSKRWEQNWIGSGGPGDRQRYYDGEFKDGAMHFKYETTGTQGEKIKGNFIFYYIGKDSVRQYQDVIDEKGDTRSVTYDLTYRRK